MNKIQALGIPKIKALGLGSSRDIVNLQQKNITIKYISSTIDEKVINLSFVVTQTNLTKFNAKVFVQEMNATNEVAVNKIVPLKNVKEQQIPVSFNKDKELDRYNWQDGFLFQATITCDGVSGETEEFPLKFVKPVIEKVKTCYCDRDFTVEELKDIVVYLRKNELISKDKAKRDEKGNFIYEDKQGEIPNDKDGKPIRKSIDKVMLDFMMYDFKDVKDKIFFLTQTEQLDSKETNYDDFAKELNKSFRNYKISTCIRKVHFLAQAYLETQQFRKTYETEPNVSNISGGEFYRGRGFLQLTHDYNYKELYKIGSGKVPTDEELIEFVPKVAKSMKIACQGSAWYWDKLKINTYADNDDSNKVSAAINRPKALNDETELNNINGLDKRILYTSYFKLAMNYENCKKNK